MLLTMRFSISVLLDKCFNEDVPFCFLPMVAILTDRIGIEFVLENALREPRCRRRQSRFGRQPRFGLQPRFEHHLRRLPRGIEKFVIESSWITFRHSRCEREV